MSNDLQFTLNPEDQTKPYFYDSGEVRGSLSDNDYWHANVFNPEKPGTYPMYQAWLSDKYAELLPLARQAKIDTGAGGVVGYDASGAAIYGQPSAAQSAAYQSYASGGPIYSQSQSQPAPAGVNNAPAAPNQSGTSVDQGNPTATQPASYDSVLGQLAGSEYKPGMLTLASLLGATKPQSWQGNSAVKYGDTMFGGGVREGATPNTNLNGAPQSYYTPTEQSTLLNMFLQSNKPITMDNYQPAASGVTPTNQAQSNNWGEPYTVPAADLGGYAQAGPINLQQDPNGLYTLPNGQQSSAEYTQWLNDYYQIISEYGQAAADEWANGNPPRDSAGNLITV